MLFYKNLNSCVLLSAVSVDGCGPSSRRVSPIAVGPRIKLKPNQKAESRTPTACEMEADRSNSLAGICRGSPGIVANQPRTHPYWRQVAGSTDGSGAGFALSLSCAVALCCLLLRCGVLNQRGPGFHSRCLQDCCLNRPPAHRVQGDAHGPGIGRSSPNNWKRRPCGRRSPAKFGGGSFFEYVWRWCSC